MASTVAISTSPTSCTPPAMGAAIRMPFAHRRWSLSPATGSRSRMAVPSWCRTTTLTRMPAKAAPHSMPVALLVNGVPVMTETGMPTSAAARARANPGCRAAPPARPMNSQT